MKGLVKWMLIENRSVAKKTVTDEQIEIAKRWDLLSYLQRYEPDELVKSATNKYRAKSDHTLVISNGKWNWTTMGFGGKDALTYLIKVREMGFVEAVELLCDGKGFAFLLFPSQFKNLARLRFPSPQGMRHMWCGIYNSEVLRRTSISLCIQQGALYESQQHHNCVFVGRDAAGTPRFACRRGTVGNFKLDVPSSSKRYSFCLPAKDETCTQVSVSEAPIDALSVATLRKYGMHSEEWKDCHYLALGGTPLLALEKFLADHPQVTQV